MTNEFAANTHWCRADTCEMAETGMNYRNVYFIIAPSNIGCQSAGFFCRPIEASISSVWAA